MEMAMFAHQARRKETSTVKFSEGTKTHTLAIEDILYLEADHVYVNIVLHNKTKILQRSSLKEVLNQLPYDKFIQTHRAFAVNTSHIDNWDNGNVYIKNSAIPMSRSRRKEVITMLKAR